MASRNESRSVNIYINGNAADQTLKQIEASSRKLRNELRQLVPDTEAFRLKTEELRSVNDRLQAINNDIRGVGGAFGWLKTEIGKLGALAVGYLGFQFVTQQFHDIIAGNAKLSDSLADVQRVAGLTSQEVLKLNAGFKDIDTRTSVAGLRNIAIIAGKLGVAKDDILGFTKAVDMLVVTLGDELGNADQITTQLGKILNVYDGKVTGDNITHLGNAMVVLANAGVASGGFIADFTQRVSGIAVSAHLSLGATVGLAAGLEELGQRSESASTAITRLLTDIANDLPKAAKIAQLPLQQFTELFNEKPEKALLAYAAGLVKNKTAFNEIATSFKDAGEEGQRVIGTLAALGNKAEFMQGKIDMGNKSLTETAAINEGFALKNETFGATVDKLSKKFSELTANKGLVSLFSALVTLTSEAIDGFNKHTAAIGGFIKLLVSGGVAYAAYNVILLASIVLQGKWIATLVETAAYTRLVEAAQTAYSVVVLLLMGRVKQARVVMLAFNESMEMNPIGLVIAAMAAAVTAVILFKDTINDAAEAQKTLNKVHNEAVEKIAEEKDKIEDLTKIINGQNESYSDRIDAIKVLRSLLPDHLKSYSDEEILAGKATFAINNYVASLEKKAEAEAAFDELKKLKADRIKIQQDKGDLNVGQYAQVIATDIFTGTDNGQKKLEKTQKDNLANQLRANQAQQDALKAKYSLELKNQLLEKPVDTGGGAPAGATKRTADVIEKEIAALQKDQKAISTTAAEWKKYEDQIKALQAEEERITGKKAGAGAKKVATLKSESQKMSDLVKQFNKDRLIEEESANQKELDSIANKYDVQIKKLQDFQAKIKASKELSPQGKKDETAKHQAEIDQLELAKNAEVNTKRLQQQAELNSKIIALRQEMGQAYQTELDKETIRINKFYDEVLAKASENEDEWFYIEENRAQDLADAKIREEKRFRDEKEQIDANGAVTEAEKEEVRKARINKKYDDEIAAKKKKFSKELQLTKEFQDAIAQLEKQRGQEIAQKTQVSQEEINKALKSAGIQAAQDLANASFEIGKANRQAETDAKIASLEKQKDAALLNTNLTEQQKAGISAEYLAKENAVKLQAWQADKDAALAQAEINLALSVLKALTSAPWPLNLISAAGSAIAGGIEISKISNQKPPQFEDGGFSAVDYKKPQGYVNRPTLFGNSASGRAFTAGEGHKTEYIVSSEQLKDPVIADFVNSMEANRGVRRFEAGGYSNATVKIKPGVSTSTAQQPVNTERLDRMEAILHGFIAKQSKINAIPVIFDNRVKKQLDAREVEDRNQANA